MTFNGCKKVTNESIDEVKSIQQATNEFIQLTIGVNDHLISNLKILNADSENQTQSKSDLKKLITLPGSYIQIDSSQLYELFGFHSKKDFDSYNLKVASMANYIRTNFLKGKNDEEVKVFFEELYLKNFNTKHRTQLGNLRINSCEDRCKSSLAGNLAIAYGTYAAVISGCPAFVVPPAIVACVAGASIAYAGGLVVANNTFKDCMEECLTKKPV